MAGTSAVAFFAPEHHQLPRSVKAKLERKRAELVMQLASDYAVDFADYRHRCGVIKGIDDAIQLCIETELELN